MKLDKFNPALYISEQWKLIKVHNDCKQLKENRIYCIQPLFSGIGGMKMSTNLSCALVVTLL